jgi:CRP-like cAMP-binding protein
LIVYRIPPGLIANHTLAALITNRILLALPASTLERIRSALGLIETARGQIIERVDTPVRDLYFVNRGLISLVKTMKDGRTVEVGAVGIEGVTGSTALFGIDTAVIENIVQIRGTAFRIGRDHLEQIMATDAPFREIMQKYARFTFGQLAQTAACNRLHSLEERCCRWLLVCHDNALSDTFRLTHEFLAMMLGVQRSGVSITAALLQRAGLIQYTRGEVTIVSRTGLEDAACECYASTNDALDELFRGSQKR